MPNRLSKTVSYTVQILSWNKTAVLHVSVRQERFRINFWRCQRTKLSKWLCLFRVEKVKDKKWVSEKKKTFVKKRTLPTGWRRVQCLTNCATRTFVNTAYILSCNKAVAVLHVSVRKERFRINFWRCQRIKLSKMALPLPELKKRRKKKGWAKKKTFVKKEPYQPSDCESNA